VGGERGKGVHLARGLRPRAADAGRDGIAQGRAAAQREREREREIRRMMWMEKKINIKGLFSYMYDHRRVWAQVAQLNKFEVLNFDFTSS
jgi:hypothetical protein